jgi:hypothetical protein
MADNSGFFVVLMCAVVKVFTTYTGDYADVWKCGSCSAEIRWKDYSLAPYCFLCESTDLVLIRKKSEF